MIDPAALYTVDEPAWGRLDPRTTVLIHLLDGYIDAGMAGHNLRAHLLETCEHEVIAEFDADQLIDYRGRRPVMTFDSDRWVAATDFTLALHRLTTPGGTPLLLLAGAEPDFQWMRVIEAVLQLCRRARVRTLVTTHGVPMQVPHTRPTHLITHVSSDDVVNHDGRFADRVDVPGSWSGMFEYVGGNAALDVLGFSAEVPHYLTQSGFPQATLAALRAINGYANLDIPEGSLPEVAAENLEAIEAQVSEADELGSAIAEMERAFDQREQDPRGGVPTPDEIGAEFERFLAAQDGGDEQDDRPGEP